MEIKKNLYKKVCDMGECRNIADFAINFEKLGVRANIDICRECLIKLYKEAKKVIYDKKCGKTQ